MFVCDQSIHSDIKFLAVQLLGMEYLGVIVTLAPYKERKNLIADTVMVFD